MKNVKFVILTPFAVVFSSTVFAYTFDGNDAIDNRLYTQDTLVLEPLSSNQPYQEAKLWFLPDYQENISSNGALKPSTPNNCASFNNDGSGRTYVETPDFNRYQCLGPLTLANKVKCYYGCVCKPAVAFDANSETCAYTCNGVCVGGVACKPSVSVGVGEYCTRSCRGNSSVCVAKACKTAVSIGTGEQCTQRCASNSSICTAKGCKSAVSLYYANDYCTQRCASNSSICTAKSCSPNANQSSCSYGTESCDNGCGGVRTCCKSCTPYANETGCAYGTESCSNGCGGTRLCCKGCTPKAAATGCSYGTESCSNGCGGTTTCCKGCVTGGSASCSGQTTACSSAQIQTASCKDCSGTTHYTCSNKSCAEQGLKECNGSCIAKTACCGCTSAQKCSNGTCINKTCEEVGDGMYYTGGCPSDKIQIWSGPMGNNPLCYQCTYYETGVLIATRLDSVREPCTQFDYNPYLGYEYRGSADYTYWCESSQAGAKCKIRSYGSISSSYHKLASDAKADCEARIQNYEGSCRAGEQCPDCRQIGCDD